MSATRAISSMYGRISAAPSAQLRPTASGLTWRIAFQNASGVWPGQRAAGRVGDRARHDERQPLPRLLEVRLDGEQRRLGVQRVEDRLDQQDVGAAFAQARDRLGVGRHELVERSRCARPGR